MASDTPPRIAAAILAGGMARRMGGANKAGLRIGNERIIDRQLRLLRQIADPVFIVAGSAEPFQELEITVVPDVVPGVGPLGGIYTALTASPCARTLIVACDLPYLTLPLLQRLAAPSDADLAEQPELPVDDPFVADSQPCLVGATHSTGQAARKNCCRDRRPGVIGHARTRRYQSWSGVTARSRAGTWKLP